jgi:hypothetical protein
MSTKAAQKKQKLLKGPMVQEGKVTIEELGKSFDSCTDAQLFAEKYVKQKTEDGEEDEEAAKLAAATNTMNFWTGQIALHLPISNFKEQVIAKALVHYGTAVKYAKEMEVASDSEYAVEGKESLWIDGTPFTELYWYTVRILTKNAAVITQTAFDAGLTGPKVSMTCFLLYEFDFCVGPGYSVLSRQKGEMKHCNSQTDRCFFFVRTETGS